MTNEQKNPKGKHPRKIAQNGDQNSDGNNLSINDELTEFLLYTAPNGDVKVEIFLHDENVWLTQKRMAELCGI